MLNLVLVLAFVLGVSLPAQAWDVEEDSYSSSPSSSDSDPAPFESRDGDENDGASSDGDSRSAPALLEDENTEEEEESYFKDRRTTSSQYDDEDDGELWGDIRPQNDEPQEDDRDEYGFPLSSYFNKKNLGMTAELTLGGYFRQSSLGDLDAKFGLGISVGWNLGRMLFDPELTLLHRGLWLEFSWLHPFSAGGDEGTKLTRVTQSQDNLSLAVIFGYPLWRLLLYGKLGPALYVGSVDYDIGYATGTSTGSWSVVRGGLVYGIGVHTMFFFHDVIGLSGRIELTGHRRQYYNDLQFTVSLGAAF
jgi:hypothetical protein